MVRIDIFSFRYCSVLGCRIYRWIRNYFLCRGRNNLNIWDFFFLEGYYIESKYYYSSEFLDSSVCYRLFRISIDYRYIFVSLRYKFRVLCSFLVISDIRVFDILDFCIFGNSYIDIGRYCYIFFCWSILWYSWFRLYILDYIYIGFDRRWFRLYKEFGSSFRFSGDYIYIFF